MKIKEKKMGEQINNMNKYSNEAMMNTHHK
jgi:hypothetical protein